MPVPNANRRLHTVAGLAATVLLLLAMAPAALADEPVDYVTDFAIVSATIDNETAIPTVTYSFRCLEHIDFLRLRSQLAQIHKGTPASSYQQSYESSCEAGATVTIGVEYGPQISRFYHGRADLSAWLEAYMGNYTVDSETITTTVKLSPAHKTR